MQNESDTKDFGVRFGIEKGVWTGSIEICHGWCKEYLFLHMVRDAVGVKRIRVAIP